MRCVKTLVGVALVLVSDLIRCVTILFWSQTSLIAENLFSRKQLAFYQEHKRKPQSLTDAARWTLVLCSRLFDWRTALVMVKPDTCSELRGQIIDSTWQGNYAVVSQDIAEEWIQSGTIDIRRQYTSF